MLKTIIVSLIVMTFTLFIMVFLYITMNAPLYVNIAFGVLMGFALDSIIEFTKRNWR